MARALRHGMQDDAQGVEWDDAKVLWFLDLHYGVRSSVSRRAKSARNQKVGKLRMGADGALHVVDRWEAAWPTRGGGRR